MDYQFVYSVLTILATTVALHLFFEFRRIIKDCNQVVTNNKKLLNENLMLKFDKNKLNADVELLTKTNNMNDKYLRMTITYLKRENKKLRNEQ